METLGRRRRVVVLGKDAKLGKLVELALKPGRFEVDVADSSDDLIASIIREQPSLIALDLELRDGDGVRLCDQLRELADVPVMFLSAADDDASKVRALRCGDDYLTRPFSLAELRARAEAVLRRARPCLDVRGPAFQDGLLTVDFGRREVTFGGVAVDLTPTEYRLLALLARNPGRVFLHEELLERVWGEGSREDTHLLRLHIANLRKKIEPDPAHPRYIKTHRGLGYAFQAPRPTPSVEPTQAGTTR